MSMLFVYNANSGFLNGLMDVGHKLISPATYSCKLCALTHDTFSENKIWKDFQENGTLDLEFYHRDEFEAKYGVGKFSYPVVLVNEGNELEEILGPSDLNKIKDTRELIMTIKEGIANTR